MDHISSTLQEARRFSPDPSFSRQANLNPQLYQALKDEAAKDYEGFWARLARQEIVWAKPFEKTLEWELPFAKWFVGGELNMSVQCLDRHLDSATRHKAAIVWEGEPGEQRTLTYQQLHREVCRFANALEASGVKAGDRVTIYLPMVVELPIAVLACARIGAPHNVIFGGFAPNAIRDRVEDSDSRVIITADGGWRRGKILNLKENVDEALASGCPTVEKVFVVKRCDNPVKWVGTRDVWWDDAVRDMPATHTPKAFDSEHPLFILYTSGTTGKPKGVVHSTAGFALWTKLTSSWVFDLKPQDMYWCTADVGWITGHSYVIYGPLQTGSTVLMYEGAPNFPEPDRFWDIIERHHVTVFYTAPTAIRAFMKWGDEHVQKHDLSSIRLLGSVGEPINPEAWMWYHEMIGNKRCPIVDTWWQTETGGIMISAIPGVTTTVPGSATFPLPGIDAAVVDGEGNQVGPNQGGYLVVRKPWPSMLRNIYNNPARFKNGYFERFPNFYFAGDGARLDEHGNFWIMGRIDDVINVAGHRLGTMEIESALVSHPSVCEAAVVPRPDDIKGQAIVAFVTLEGEYEPSEALAKELADHVVHEIGALARPSEIRFTDTLPKTRSGKIMRRLLSDIAAGRETGDTTSLEDEAVLDKLREP